MAVSAVIAGTPLLSPDMTHIQRHVNEIPVGSCSKLSLIPERLDRVSYLFYLISQSGFHRFQSFFRFCVFYLLFTCCRTSVSPTGLASSVDWLEAVWYVWYSVVLVRSVVSTKYQTYSYRVWHWRLLHRHKTQLQRQIFGSIQNWTELILRIRRFRENPGTSSM